MQELRTTLHEHAEEAHAVKMQGFFKTAPGEYGEGDQFIGVRVPTIRKLAKQYQNLPLSDTRKLLQSKTHEERLLALIILTMKYRKGTTREQTQIYELYLANRRHINNWDLVDTSAEHIVGAFLNTRSRKPLYTMARSQELWDRRIAIMASFHFIKHGEFDDTLQLAELLITDPEDLIHKAVGWMLREVGKRDIAIEQSFLQQHSQRMPRTMLRYAIEKFPEDLRQQYLKGKVTVKSN